MAKIRKAVFKSGIVMMSLLAAYRVEQQRGPGATDCIEARAATTNDAGNSVADGQCACRGHDRDGGGRRITVRVTRDHRWD